MPKTKSRTRSHDRPYIDELRLRHEAARADPEEGLVETRLVASRGSEGAAVGVLSKHALQLSDGLALVGLLVQLPSALRGGAMGSGGLEHVDGEGPPLLTELPRGQLVGVAPRGMHPRPSHSGRLQVQEMKRDEATAADGPPSMRRWRTCSPSIHQETAVLIWGLQPPSVGFDKLKPVIRAIILQ